MAGLKLAVHEQRKRIARVLRKNPSLKSRIPEATEEGYEDARDDAAETGIAKKLFRKPVPMTGPRSRRASSNLKISGRRKSNMMLELRPIP